MTHCLQKSEYSCKGTRVMVDSTLKQLNIKFIFLFQSSKTDIILPFTLTYQFCSFRLIMHCILLYSLQPVLSCQHLDFTLLLLLPGLPSHIYPTCRFFSRTPHCNCLVPNSFVLLKRMVIYNQCGGGMRNYYPY